MQDAIPVEHSTGPDAALRSRLAGGPNALFAYGTLQFEAVLTPLLGRMPQSSPTTAPGWRAAALERRVYPGLVPASGAAAPGLLLTGLSPREWEILDAFEDDEYELRQITLASGDRGWAYLWREGEVRAETWDADDFAARHLPAFAALCARIAPDLAADDNRPGTRPSP
ncbi:gamma-glutamylcyclotransferase family protein [Streptomyces coffeae]|uniref:Putative gamma-glutamylcyclotransferase n=1 Tax=Streptomyces coffeae TaxID=621382 RepID=A0ABS1NPF1_9ACTN|nr:gamma-glutamylcyclotransferase family protein [Streptomyces coffeae]MBL1101976.1 gamma-glutamylcyclotransferase [Streptomyces coffeae]